MKWATLVIILYIQYILPWYVYLVQVCTWYQYQAYLVVQRSAREREKICRPIALSCDRVGTQIIELSICYSTPLHAGVSIRSRRTAQPELATATVLIP